jgi:hypothetical protein
LKSREGVRMRIAEEQRGNSDENEDLRWKREENELQ